MCRDEEGVWGRSYYQGRVVCWWGLHRNWIYRRMDGEDGEEDIWKNIL